MSQRLFSLFISLFLSFSLPAIAFPRVENSDYPERELPDQREPIYDLLQTMRARLIIMHEVARYKWNQKLPIVDLEREKVLLAHFAEEAEALGIEPEFAGSFLQAQMDAAKILQKRDFVSWQEENHPPFERVLDLKKEIRPLLDKITKELLQFLSKIPCSSFSDERLWISIGENILCGYGIDQVVREIALKPFIQEPTFLKRPLFVQAGPGSFNHQALQYVFLEDVSKVMCIHFCGSIAKTLEDASFSNRGLAFMAIRNSLIEKGWIPQNFEALKGYQIVKVDEAVSMKIEMSLLRLKEAIDIPLSKIAAHPAAFLQIHQWKEGLNLQEIPVAQGSSEAARKLVSGEFSLDTGVIGPKALETVYPSLVTVEKGIQDSKDNETLFALIEVKLLDAPLSDEVLENHLASLFSKYGQNDPPTEYFRIY